MSRTYPSCAGTRLPVDSLSSADGDSTLRASPGTGRPCITGAAGGRRTAPGGQIPDRLRAGCDEAEGADWTISANSTVVRAHQHAARARRAMPAELVTGATPRLPAPPRHP